VPKEVARVPIGTAAGEFDLRAFECGSGFVYVALVKGELGDGQGVLTRVHSECLTGDALGSLRCDCGVQLRTSLRLIAAEGRGVLLYHTGQEGRAIGLVAKLRAYVLQDDGLDTVDANHHLGLPADFRDYGDAAACLGLLGIKSVRLMTNNPLKEGGLRGAGIAVDEVIPLATSAHLRNRDYLATKERRLRHVEPAGSPLLDGIGEAIDVAPLLGPVVTPPERPFVVLKYAQTLDGRIATRSGDSKWISGERERSISHALRAACDGVLVGVRTAIIDDPQLTVRLVPGSSPLRVVLDSSLRLPRDAKLLHDDAGTLLLTTDRSSPERRRELAECGVGVRVVGSSPAGLNLAEALSVLRDGGVRSLLVEGGARIITSFLAGGLADRVVVGIAPTIVGSGTEAVGELHVSRIANGLRLTDPSVYRADDDLLIAAGVARP
jgi:3,4-dihydroxy 2-butanone 4-phosphate synthase/GTP cyclohydrolase II